MGYLLGFVKYVVKSSYRNTYPMLVFGAATLAILVLIDELVKGRPVAGLVGYAITKYLPPLTVEALFTVLAVGCVWAGIRWYWKTPRR